MSSLTSRLWASLGKRRSRDLMGFGSFPTFPGGSYGKESACSTGDKGAVPGLGRSPGERTGYPLQYSCLENPMDRGVWTHNAQLKYRVLPSFRFPESGSWALNLNTTDDYNAGRPYLKKCYPS